MDEATRDFLQKKIVEIEKELEGNSRPPGCWREYLPTGELVFRRLMEALSEPGFSCGRLDGKEESDKQSYRVLRLVTTACLAHVALQDDLGEDGFDLGWTLAWNISSIDFHKSIPDVVSFDPLAGAAAQSQGGKLAPRKRGEGIERKFYRELYRILTLKAGKAATAKDMIEALDTARKTNSGSDANSLLATLDFIGRIRVVKASAEFRTGLKVRVEVDGNAENRDEVYFENRVSEFRNPSQA